MYSKQIERPVYQLPKCLRWVACHLSNMVAFITHFETVLKNKYEYVRSICIPDCPEYWDKLSKV